MLFFMLTCCTTGEKVIFTFDPSKIKTGPYGVEDLKRDWRHPPWENGISQGLVSIADDNSPNHPRVLQVFYPKGSFSASTIGKTQWILKFNKTYNELYCSYYIKFGKDFNFVKTGKLPGLVGGKHNSGGEKPNGFDGWSSRVVWLVNGEIGQYVYHTDQPSKYGQVFKYSYNGNNVLIERDRWYKIANRVVMNTPWKKNGIMQAWIDDNLVLDIRNLRFRNVDSFGIDAFYFSTFFGGNDESFAAVKDEYVFFDRFLISSTSLAHP